MANVPTGEWLSLLDFERTKRSAESSSSMMWLTKIDQSAGFSVDNLLEALARFWDVHILGPDKVLGWRGLQEDYSTFTTTRRPRQPDDYLGPYIASTFDQAMLGETYSEPYKALLHAVGSQKAIVAFPIISYFALQGPTPVKVYSQAVKRLDDILKLETSFSIHDAWREHFGQTREPLL